MSQRQAILTVGLLLATSGSLFGQSVLYVDRSATGPLHDGSTWCQASIELHEALDVAVSGDVIRVADGIYLPSSAGLANPRLATFQLVSGVSIEGGYAGCGAINPDERDIVAYESVLSGDLSGNDGPDFANDGDNSYHVVTYRLHGVTDVVLDGFTVRAGNADGTGPPGTLTNQGPGIHIRDDNYKCIQGGPTIRNCLIRNNRAGSPRGGQQPRLDHRYRELHFSGQRGRRTRGRSLGS